MSQEKESLNKIRQVVIVSKVYQRPVGSGIRDIVSCLQEQGVETFVDQNTKVGFNLNDLPCVSRKQMRDKDLIIVVGGDGSMLGAARTLVDLQVPMLGINRGHLGLLTDVSPCDLKRALKLVVSGRYTKEQRVLLDVRVFRTDEDGAGELVGQSLAMNETVIHSGLMAHMMTFRVSIDDREMYSLRGDGIIVNTPTGSTAYSLSAGGPIIDPHLDVLSLVPMFPQSLNCSPIIISGKCCVQIDFVYQTENTELVNINCDGQVTIRADTRCQVSIRQHRTPLTLIHPEGYDYYQLLRQKLGFGRSLV